MISFSAAPSPLSSIFPNFRVFSSKSGLCIRWAKDWKQEKGMTEEEMVIWHYCLNGHEFEQAPGDGEGQGSLACCSLWGLKESDMTE